MPKWLTWLCGWLPPLYLPADEKEGDDGGDGEGDGDEGEGDDSGGGELSEAEKRAEALAKDNEKLRADARKAKADARKRDQDKRTAKAIENDKLKDELDKRNEELEALRERNEKHEEESRSRVDAKIAKLPKDVQDEIALIKEDLPLAKLEALVEKRTAPPTDDKKGGKPPPSIGMGGGEGHKPQGHEIHAETKQVLKQVYAQPRQFEVAKGLGVSSDGKFGWGRTDDENETTANFIHLLNTIKAEPTGGVSDDVLANRVLKNQK